MQITTQDDKRGRGRPREFDRDQALASAMRLFWKKGYASVSIMDLCNQMEISPPSFYAAFGNKAALFLEVAALYEKIFWQEPAERIMAEPDIYKAVADYFQTAAEIMLAPQAPYGRISVLSDMEETGEVEAELIKIRQTAVGMFSQRMRQAIDAGQIPPDTDVPAVAGCLTALLDGLALQARQNVFLSQLKAMAALAPRLLPAPRGGERCSVHAQVPDMSRRKALIAPF